MVKIWVGVTDNKWFDFLSRIPAIDEVNFWQPSGQANFRAVEPGSLFVFKLKAPRNVIGGFGVFSHTTSCPVSLAWEAFGIKNGAASFDEMRSAIAANRREQPSRHEDFTIGCRILTQPVFLEERDWIPVPTNWASNIVVGRAYDVEEPEGRRLWEQLQSHVARLQPQELREDPAEYLGPEVVEPGARFGQPTLVRPRLGQGAFRMLVTDVYERKCAVTQGKVLPALDVAHIRPYADGGEHRISNGLLLRRDIHTLLDRGYVTIEPSLRFIVSNCVKTEFNNGEEYRRLHGKMIIVPENPRLRPDAGLLDWHNRVVFKD
jgi:putative restriction endonuclease